MGGNGGIGTTNPVAPLHVRPAGVNSSSSFNSLRLDNQGTGGFAAGHTNGLLFHWNSIEAGKVATVLENTSTWDTSMTFATAAGTAAATEKMRILANGNVGIGTTAPAAALHVTGAAIVSGGVQPDYDSGWIADNNTANHNTTLTHNLGVYPTKCVMWFSTTNPPSGSIYPRDCRNEPNQSAGAYYQNPLGIRTTTTQLVYSIAAGAYMFTTWDAGTGWSYWNSGYYRVCLWK